MITIYDWFGYELPLKERYRIIKEVGFDGVLLWRSEHLRRGDCRKGPELFREAGAFYRKYSHTVSSTGLSLAGQLRWTGNGRMISSMCQGLFQI